MKNNKIYLTLEEGKSNGITTIKSSSWKDGEIVSIPSEVKIMPDDCAALERAGICILWNESEFKVEASKYLRKDIIRLSSQGIWRKCVGITHINDTLSSQDLIFLKKRIVTELKKILKQKNKGNKDYKVVEISAEREKYLNSFIKYAFNLLSFAGIGEEKHSDKKNCIEENSKGGAKGKDVAISYLRSKGIDLKEKRTFATKQEKKDEYWANPNPVVLTEDWSFIIHDRVKKELVVFMIPANTFSVDYGKHFLKTRENGRLEIKFSRETMTENVSRESFKEFLINIVQFDQ